MVIQISFVLSQATPINSSDIDKNILLQSNFLNKSTIFHRTVLHKKYTKAREVDRWDIIGDYFTGLDKC